MKPHRLSSAVLLLFGTVGCASPDRVAFVTDTEIGIGADTTVGNVNIGYDRNELVIGPAYPETGALPPVYAKLDSDLAIFNPRIQQIYATGEAARLVTDPMRPPREGPPLNGKRRLMVFGTTTNFGLKVHFVGQQPSSFNFGYKRKEFSVLPLLEQATEPQTDHYGSVIAGIALRVRANSPTDTGINASQFIATGDAADNLARTPEIQGIYNNEAEAALALAAVKGIPAVEVDLLSEIAPICRKSLERAGDAALAAQLEQIESELGFTLAAFCANPTAEQLTAARAKMRAHGLI